MTDNRVEKALKLSKRLLELHERGPIGKLESHRIAVNVWKACPICGERFDAP
jgi:hypothetical protein